MVHKHGDCHPKYGSPVIDAGTEQRSMGGAADLEGEMRILGPAVNLGVYESIVYPPGTLIMLQ